jgi:hypothetical protein
VSTLGGIDTGRGAVIRYSPSGVHRPDRLTLAVSDDEERCVMGGALLDVQTRLITSARHGPLFSSNVVRGRDDSMEYEIHSVGDLLPGVLRKIIQHSEDVQGPLPEKEREKIFAFIAYLEGNKPDQGRVS